MTGGTLVWLKLGSLKYRDWEAQSIAILAFNFNPCKSVSIRGQVACLLWNQLPVLGTQYLLSTSIRLPDFTPL